MWTPLEERMNLIGTKFTRVQLYSFGERFTGPIKFGLFDRKNFTN